MLNKKCTKCGEEKPATIKYFPSDKRNKSGIAARCRKCRQAYRKRWRKEINPEAAKRLYRKAHFKKLYNITIEDYDRMYFKQNGVCMTCGKPETTKNQWGIRRLSVDHDHKTGKVRGLLCTCCNRLIGLARDDVSTLKRIIEYLGDK